MLHSVVYPGSIFLPRSKDQQSISLLLHQNPHLKLHHLKQIQAQLFRRSLDQDNIIITKIISICSSSGTMKYATGLFYSVQQPDLILCNSMLKAYSQNSLFKHTLLFYVQMLQNGYTPDSFSFPCVLKACAGLPNVGFGLQMHASVVKVMGVSGEVFVLNSIVDMYIKGGHSEYAIGVFRKIAKPNASSWNIIISSFVNSGDLGLAQKLFDEMPARDTVSWNTLINGYAKMGELGMAQRLFDEMPQRNLVTWNAMIAGFSQNGRHEKALSLFSQMLKAGFEPDNATLLTVISSFNEAISFDSSAVDQIVSFARPSNSLSVLTAVLNLYAKKGRVDEARKVFNEIPEKDVITWNAMIGGYSQNQRPLEAVELFKKMQEDHDVKPDEVTMVSLITCCSQMGALGLGEWVHAYIEKNGIEFDMFLVTALIDMYARCGDLNHSRILFEEMPVKDLASWNAMIKGLAIHGQGKEGLKIFSQMECSRVMPNDITFVSLLSACSHAGLVVEGLELFNLMQSRYNMVPMIEHYGCVVDLLGRSGQLVEAYEFIKQMPIRPDKIVWGALLGACQSHQNIELAEAAARQLVELDPGHDGNYVLLSNVYASVGRWRDVSRVRTQMRAYHAQKTPGCSAVELEGTVYEFVAGDRSHEKSEEIYKAWDKLAERIKPMGYQPDFGALLRNLDEEDKEVALYRHSEKLALSFALISSRDKSPIRIVKNLRICNDCHKAMELVSKLEQREIVVRDRNRFHHFNGGQCSCGGYW